MFGRFIFLYFVGIVLFIANVKLGSTTSIAESSKKSIFGTSNANRINRFIYKAFAPLTDSGELSQIAFGEYPCGAPSKFRFSSGFELHSPYSPLHLDGGFAVEDLEDEYAIKWENLMSVSTTDEDDTWYNNNNEDNNDKWYYDAILDNVMTLWVTDLSDFDEYNKDYVDRLYLQWEWDDKTYYSMFLHNAYQKNDLNQFELISDTFSGKTDDELLLLPKSEPRAYFNQYIDYAKVCQENGYSITPVGIRRAVSNVEKNIHWYKVVFGDTILPNENLEYLVSGETIDVNGNNVKYSHLLLDSTDGFTISFYQRDGERATYGDLSIVDIENQMNAAHRNVMVNPFCCVDRWYDMHYAIPLLRDEPALSVLQNIMESGDRYTVYYNQLEDYVDEYYGSQLNGGGLLSNNEKDDNNDNNNNKRKSKDKQNNNNNKIRAYGNENPSNETIISMFWALVEPNGQMVQVTGIEVNKEDWTTLSGSFIEMFVTPTYWDGTWCPMNNTDQFDEYEFGDDIATIEIIKSNEQENNDKILNQIGGLNKLDERNEEIEEDNWYFPMKIGIRFAVFASSIAIVAITALVIGIIRFIKFLPHFNSDELNPILAMKKIGGVNQLFSSTTNNSINNKDPATIELIENGYKTFE